MGGKAYKDVMDYGGGGVIVDINKRQPHFLETRRKYLSNTRLKMTMLFTSDHKVKLLNSLYCVWEEDNNTEVGTYILSPLMLPQHTHPLKLIFALVTSLIPFRRSEQFCLYIM